MRAGLVPKGKQISAGVFPGSAEAKQTRADQHLAGPKQLSPPLGKRRASDLRQDYVVPAAVENWLALLSVATGTSAATHPTGERAGIV
jgi:hypothetical protein